MKNRIALINLLIILLSLNSCKNDQQILHKNITGRAYEMVIVIPDGEWNAEPGKLIQETLGQIQLILPQDEPVFDLINIPPKAFKSIFKSTRNILQVEFSSTFSEPKISFTDDVWAYPQATVQIKAPNAEAFAKVFNKNSERILAYFMEAEKERMTMNYNKYYEKSVYNKLDQDFGITMKVPPGFRIVEQKEDLIWFKYETPDISQGVVVYTFPYVSDTTLTKKYLVEKRDEILKINVPGPIDGSYMATEKRVDPVFRVFTHNGNYATDMRGLWRLMNDFMGGPYVSIAELDIFNQRVVVAYGYVYAPGKDKRNYINQVEAMIYSLKFNDQDKNDKLNSQMNLGN
ncbi:MAG: hypothetical protein CSA36_08405 [Draconibacterium sp.]|nr:MAG: hypothetical protein CSA36_08405 [Draconibacterium sp.]